MKKECRGKLFEKKFSPAPLSKTFAQKYQKKIPNTRTDSWREDNLAFAAAIL